MTLTKMQKARKVAAKGGMSSVPKVAKQMRKRTNRATQKRSMDFLNGNSFSFLNTSLGRQGQARVTAPVANGFAGLSSKAKITASSGSTKVRHSEYVMDIPASDDFLAISESINPGNPELFPWLAALARLYESYKFESLTFRFETTSPTNTSGTVILTVDYNPEGTVPNSKVEALAMESAVRSPVWNRVNHSSLSHNLNKRKSYYVRNDDSIVSDMDLFDTGLMIVMVEGVPADLGGAIGELYVDYVVDLSTPILTNQTFMSGKGAIITGTNAAHKYPWDGVVIRDPTGTELSFAVGAGINVNTDTGPATNIGAVKFGYAGTYMVDMQFTSDDPGDTFDPTKFASGFFGGGQANSAALNITPGGGVTMNDSTDKISIGLYAIRIAPGSGNPTFGVAYTDTLAGNLVTRFFISSFNGTYAFSVPLQINKSGFFKSKQLLASRRKLARENKKKIQDGPSNEQVRDNAITLALSDIGKRIDQSARLSVVEEALRDLRLKVDSPVSQRDDGTTE